IAFLGLVFLVKAAIWPLCFWLPSAYGAGSAPVVAMFAIATKVGIYAILRLSMLLIGPEAGPSTGFGAQALMVGGLATIVFGTLGALASQALGRITAHLLLISSGTVLAAVGFALVGSGPGILAGGLFYLVGSTLATGALFLLAEPMARGAGGAAGMLALTEEVYGAEAEGDEDVEPEFGYAISGSIAVIGLSFGICCILLAGLPPVRVVLGQYALVRAVFRVAASGTPAGWWFLGILFVSGFATLVALARFGMQTIWAGEEQSPPILVLEVAPIIALIGLTLLLTVKADAVMSYIDDTARALTRPALYVDGVFHTPRMREQGQGE